MNNTIESGIKTPGIVILAAVLNFISVSFFLFLAVLSILGVIFGNAMGMAEFISQQIQRHSQSPNFSYGLTFVFASMFVVSLFFLLYFLFIGIGLLKGKALAWYLQVAMSILGLVGFPIFTLINGFILFLFFGHNVRSYFKV